MRPILAFTIALSLIAPPPVSAQTGEAETGCVFMPDSDLGRFEEGPEVMARAEAAALRTARSLDVSLTPPRGFTAGRVVITGSRGYAGGPDVIAAFRAADGRWFVRARAPAVDLRSGRPMSAEQARTTEAALRDSCLAREPHRAPRGRPSRYKGEFIVCADGQDVFFDIGVPGVLSRKLFHECSTHGAAKRLQAALQAAGFGDRP